MKMIIVPNVDDNISSSPVYKPEIIEAAQNCQPRPNAYEVSLQQLDGTEYYQWHYRNLNSAYWFSSGAVMKLVIEK